MKFGKQLHNVLEESDKQFVDKFMDYKVLKKVIKACVAEAGGQSEIDPLLMKELGIESGKLKGNKPALKETVEKLDRMPQGAPLFFCKLDEEVEKVNAFFASLEKGVRESLRVVLDKYKTLGPKPTKEAVTSLRGEFLELNRHLIQIEQFVFFNLTGFHKILKKFDKKTGYSVRQQFVDDISIQPFVASTMIPKLVKLSEAKFRELHELSKKFGDENGVTAMNGNGNGNGAPPLSPQVHPANKTPLQVVFAMARQMLSTSDGTTPDAQALSGPVNKLTMSDLGPVVTAGDNKSMIQYFDLYDDTEFSLGVFILSKGARIPLHERPRGGCGVTRVLKGRVQVKSYAFVGGESKRRRLSNAEIASEHQALQAVVSLNTVHTPESPARVVNANACYAMEYEALEDGCIIFNVSTGPSVGDYESWQFYETTGTASGNLIDVIKLTPVRSPRGFSIHRESYVSWNRANSRVTPIVEKMPAVDK